MLFIRFGLFFFFFFDWNDRSILNKRKTKRSPAQELYKHRTAQRKTMDLYSSWNLLGPFFFFSKIKPCKTMHENNVNVKIIFWGETWLVSGILQVMSLPGGKSGAGGFEHAWTGSGFGCSPVIMKLWPTAQGPFRQACVPYVGRAWRD